MPLPLNFVTRNQQIHQGRKCSPMPSILFQQRKAMHESRGTIFQRIQGQGAFVTPNTRNRCRCLTSTLSVLYQSVLISCQFCDSLPNKLRSVSQFRDKTFLRALATYMYALVLRVQSRVPRFVGWVSAVYFRIRQSFAQSCFPVSEVKGVVAISPLLLAKLTITRVVLFCFETTKGKL